MGREKNFRNGRSISAINPNLFIEDISSFGVNTDQGNLVSIQPFMVLSDYATLDNYYAKLDGYLAVAQSEGWFQPRTIIVFPEYIGTWLAVTGEKEAVFSANTLAKGMQHLVLRNLPSFLATLPRAKGKDKLTDTVLRMKAQHVAKMYQDTFARLASNYEITIVAGSLILPTPSVINNKIVVSKDAMQNVSFVFRPDGTLHSGIVRKIFPVGDEAAFIGAGSAHDLPIFDTPVGRLAVLICADSWYPASYKALAAHEPDYIVVPNNEVPADSWYKIWSGYDPGPPPHDVDPKDAGQLTNGEAWLKYALAGRLSSTNARAGMHTFFRGQMWDLSGAGHTIIVTPDQVFEARHVKQAALVNYWL